MDVIVSTVFLLALSVSVIICAQVGAAALQPLSPLNHFLPVCLTR